ncbi:MAG: helix-turn-helix domain-containing protein [Acidimicrobiales bacterium]
MVLDLAARARLHAALGDPHRLAVVDALHLSDRSPSELADMLGLGSNLMAHHLGVLEDLGVIVRVASEGDRRKRYVQLVPSTLSGLRWGGGLRAQRIIFVCTENSARSQLAEAIWNQRHSVPATSAGIAPATELQPGALEVAARRGIDLTGACPKPLPELSQDDLVISVCDRAHDALAERGGMRELHWSVPDPAGPEAVITFDQAADVLTDRIASLEHSVSLV